MKIVEGHLSVDKSKRVAIINARFNHFITDRLVEGAKDAYARHGGDSEDLDLILVPGAFEVPFALDWSYSTLRLCISRGYKGSS